MTPRTRTSLFISFAIVIVVSAAAATGYFFWQKSAFKNVVPRTPGGVLFEELLPPDAFFIGSFNPTDDSQREEFKRIVDTVLQDQKEALSSLLSVEIDKKLNDKTISEEKKETLRRVAEFLPQFYDKNARFTLAAGGATTIDNPAEKFKNAEIYMLFLMQGDPQHQEKVHELIHWMFEEQLKEIKETGKKFHTGVLGDVAFITTEDPERLKARFENKEPSFADSDTFHEIGKSFKTPFLGYIFSALVTPESPQRFSAITMHALPEGFRFDGITFADEKKISETGFGFFFKPHAASLYKKIPVKNALLFLEMYDFGSLLKLGYNNAVRQGMPLDGFSSFKMQTGFDFNEDIAPFLDREMAFVLDDRGTLMPFMSFYFDVASAPEKAETVMKKMDGAIGGLIPLLNLGFNKEMGGIKDEAYKPLVELLPMANTKVGRTAKIYLSRIPKDQVNIPLLDFFPDPIEFSYGITSDNILFFSMVPDFEKTWGASDKKTIESHELFADITRMNLKPGTIALVDIQSSAAYVQRIFDLVGKYKSLTEEQRKGWELVKKYLSPIQGMIEVVQGENSSYSASVLFKIK